MAKAHQLLNNLRGIPGHALWKTYCLTWLLWGRKFAYEKDLLSRLEKEHIRYLPEGDVPQSWLGVPMRVGEQVVGALVVENWQKAYSFSKNDEATLETVTRQVAVAIDNARLYEQLENKNEQLERKNKNLRTLVNEVGQRLTRGLVKQEKEILDLIYKSATDCLIWTRATCTLRSMILILPSLIQREEILGMLPFCFGV